MVLHNRGPAVARDVNVKLAGVDRTNLPFMPGEMLPIPFLDGGQEYPIRFFPTFTEAVLLDVTLTWHDDEGPKEKRVRAGWD